MHRAKYIDRRQVFEKETSKLNQIWTMWFFFLSFPSPFGSILVFGIEISQIYKLVNLDTESNFVDHEDKCNISCNRNCDGIRFIIIIFFISIERTLVKILRTSIAIIFFYILWWFFKSPICIYLFIYLFIVSVIQVFFPFPYLLTRFHENQI